MRSHYDDFAAGETNKLNSNDNNNNDGAIPYHARENSLPFSYGQINKTSTPLRPTITSSTTSSLTRRSSRNTGGLAGDIAYDYGYGNSALNGSVISGGVKDVSYNNTLTQNSDRANNNNYGSLNSEKYFNDICPQTVKYNSNSNLNSNSNVNSNNEYKTISNTDEIDASMIKTQPRLTSPLLVRKTLSNGSNNISGSRSPTRSTTNTIANTYHYSFGNDNNKNGNYIGDTTNFDKFDTIGSRNSNTYTTTKTPARHDFDELLRKRREKVFNEYRSTTHDFASSKASPVPPPRRFANGTVQLPSTLPPSLSHKSSSSLYSPHTLNRSQSQNSKYNYDIEFNLNLNDRRYDQDEVDDIGILRRRTNTIDSSPRRPQPQYLQQKQQQQQPPQQQQQQQLYQTRDIPLTPTSSSSYVERNYHTISSSSALTHPKNNDKNNNSTINRKIISPTSMLDIYSTPYDERIKRPNVLQPLEATTSASTTTTTVQRSQRSTDYNTYGNGNMYGDERPNLGHTMRDRESSPIYATSTKKVTTNNSSNTLSASSAAFYRNNVTTTIPTSPLSASTTTLTVVNYPSPTSARPETPAFPLTPRTPFASHTATLNSKQVNGSYHQQYLQQQSQHYQPSNAVPVEQNYSVETIYGTNNYRPRLNSSLSMTNSEPQEVAAHLVKFAKDSSKFWYKPNLSRDDAISLLLNAAPGTFVVRDSTTYKDAYGLVLRVAQPPPGTATTGKPDELVRHFLIEPTTRGVRLKGCENEPGFTSLSALVYQHSINRLALPCVLHIPDRDLVPPRIEPTPAQKQLMTQGAACNVLWLFSCETESLTGEEAIRKAIRQMYNLPTPPTPTEVHFKVTQQGITLTDNTRKKFFRKHYTADIISYCAIDPDHRLWSTQEHGNDNTTVVGSLKKTIFAFVARRSASSKDNQCHIFCDLAINQPASAIVSFVNKTLPTEKQKNYVL